MNRSGASLENLANDGHVAHIILCCLHKLQPCNVDLREVRKAARPTVLGKGTILSWDDVAAAQKRQDQKVISKARPTERKTKRRAAALRPMSNGVVTGRRESGS